MEPEYDNTIIPELGCTRLEFHDALHQALTIIKGQAGLDPSSASLATELANHVSTCEIVQTLVMTTDFHTITRLLVDPGCSFSGAPLLTGLVLGLRIQNLLAAQRKESVTQ